METYNRGTGDGVAWRRMIGDVRLYSWAWRRIIGGQGGRRGARGGEGGRGGGGGRGGRGGGEAAFGTFKPSGIIK